MWGGSKCPVLSETPSFQQRINETCKETGKYDPCSEKNKQTDNRHCKRDQTLDFIDKGFKVATLKIRLMNGRKLR